MRKLLIIVFAILFSTNISFSQEKKPYQLSTHILDISKGKPAEGVVVSLYKYNFETQTWDFVDKALTADNGRIESFLPAGEDNYGAYKLRFETQEYFTDQSQESIYPYIEIAFKITDQDHYHIPITVSANGYSTYRGS